MNASGQENNPSLSGVGKSSEHKNEIQGKENVTLNPTSPVPQIHLNKSVLSPSRRKSGSPLSIIRNFASLSNRGSPTSQKSPRKGSSSPFSKYFSKVSFRFFDYQLAIIVFKKGVCIVEQITIKNL